MNNINFSFKIKKFHYKNLFKLFFNFVREKKEKHVELASDACQLYSRRLVMRCDFKCESLIPKCSPCL